MKSSHCPKYEEKFQKFCPEYLGNDISFRGYQAKCNEKRQGEGGGHKIGEMGRRHLWMAPLWFLVFHS